MQTWHIHIKGQVQGVGFRPFVCLLAQQFQLTGWVNNDVDGVHIEFNAVKQKAINFLKTILDKPPILAQITAYDLTEISTKNFSSFDIKTSQNKGKPNLLLTPDAAICADCTKELLASDNRRNAYPFITCTNCGPRYSIIQRLPYDRPFTTMDRFKMCPNCQKEYENASNRRYYSQTNSCPACAIELTFHYCPSKVGDTLKVSPTFPPLKLIEKVIQAWQAGKIVAIKGIGGYLLTCDASNETVVQILRQKKHRLSKPFAVMFPNFKLLQKELVVSKAEQELLTSIAAPIVLLKNKKISDTLAPSIAPNLDYTGALLPYTPLYHLLLKKFDQPIIATSGNISNSPIIYDNEKAVKELSSLADFIITNNRKIAVPQDDSVVKFTDFKQQKIILRRSRGYAPTYINPKLKVSPTTILTMGAMLKSTFTLTHQSNLFISQYLGDLENFETEQSYQHTINHFLALFKTKPEIILLDKHPQYPSSIYGQALAAQFKLPSRGIQHHEAHFAAILGEHHLIDNQEPILGVIWDGTGLGNDGHIWGGEFFVYQNYQFERRHHLAYVDFILGDKMAKEPRISALSFCWGITEAMPILKEKFSKIEWSIYHKLLEKESALKTSSIGRLFDAIASLVGILDKQTYEGEAAMLLEIKALQYFQKNGLSANFSSFDENKDNFNFTTKDILRLLLADLRQEASTEYIAAHFHFLLVKYIENVAINQNIRQLAFSGGVFQNGLLVDLITHYLGDNFDLYFHKELSPNDENISFGQLVHYHINNCKTTL